MSSAAHHLVLMFSSPWQHRFLLGQLVRRTVLVSYRGSVAGVLWSLAQPLLMLAVYTFVFGTVFKVRWWGTGNEHGVELAVTLFVGLLVFRLLSDCLARAPNLVVEQAHLVKRIVFPLEILPWVALGGALFQFAAGLLILLVALPLVRGGLPWTAVLAPLVIAPLALMCLGLGWSLAAIGVYLRDTEQAMGVVLSALLFLSPIFYPLAALPAPYRPYLLLNPATFPIEQARAVLLHGRVPDWFGLGLYTLIALAVAWLGVTGFQRARAGFADVL
jgi:lipopolysaccharide transport system permease protein